MMQRRRATRHWVEALVDGKQSLAIYVLFTIVVAVPGSGLYDVLAVFLGDFFGSDRLGKIFATGIGVVLVGVLAGFVWLLTYVRHRGVISTVDSVPGPISRRRGLITIVSPGARLDEIPASVAIRLHQRGEHDKRSEATLEYLWLLCSADPPGERSPTSSAANARALKERYGPDLKHVEILEVGDYDDPEEVFEKADEAYRQARKLKLSEAEIIADITGGTKSMSIGLACAGIGSTRALQFLKPRQYLADGTADRSAGSEPRLVNVSFIPTAASD